MQEMCLSFITFRFNYILAGIGIARGGGDKDSGSNEMRLSTVISWECPSRDHEGS